MKVIENVHDTAWTDELGGKFENLKLKIKARLKPDQEKLAKKVFTPLTNTEKGKIQMAFDPIKWNAIYSEETLGLVTDWENLISQATGKPIPFSKENAIKFLWVRADWETGHDVELSERDEDGKKTGETKIRKATLFEYINKFSTDITNYEKN
jgi:hypothetical protein